MHLVSNLITVSTVMKIPAGSTIQSVPPLDDPDRAPDLLIGDSAVADTIEAIGVALAADDDETTFVGRVSAASAAGDLDPEALLFALAFLLGEFVRRIEGDEGDRPAAEIFRDDFITPLAADARAIADPIPGWIVPIPRIDLRSLIAGEPQSLETMVRLQLAVAGADFGPGIHAYVADGSDEITSHDVRIAGLQALPGTVIASATVDGLVEQAGQVLEPTMVDLASTTVLTWALEFMDEAIPGLASSFLDDAIRVRIPRGDLSALSDTTADTTTTTTTDTQEEIR